jgi:hypothetical protein
MKKILASGLAALTIVGGSVALAGIASADDAPATTTADGTAGTTDTAAPGKRLGKRGSHLEAAASFLGTTVEDLRTRLQGGETLAQIAGNRSAALIDHLVAAAGARIDEAVASGKLDAAKAAEMKTKTTERITTMVNEGKPAGAPGRGHRGPRGERPAAAPSTSGTSSTAPAATSA